MKKEKTESIQLLETNVMEVLAFLGVIGKGAFHECGMGIDVETGKFLITTQDGVKRVRVKDYILRYPNGNMYVCKEHIMKAVQKLTGINKKKSKG